MTGTARARKLHYAKASRQALTLCEASLLARPRVTAHAAKAALRAAGVPPHLAARLRVRLRLNTEPGVGR